MRTRPFRPQERRTSDWPTVTLGRPGTWPSVRDVTFKDVRAGTAVVYLVSGTDGTDPLVQTDERDRRVAEAFTAIPFKRAGPVGMDVLPDREAVRRFVLTFGPVGLMWSDVRAIVRNSSAQRRVQESLENIGSEVRNVRETVARLDAMASDPGADSSREVRELVAAHISSRLSATHVRAVVDPTGAVGLTLDANSLVDVIYWQLIDHAMKRPARSDLGPTPVFRIPWCGYCGGAILGTRIAEERLNRWHPGCKSAGQAARRRAERRAR